MNSLTESSTTRAQLNDKKREHFNEVLEDESLYAPCPVYDWCFGHQYAGTEDDVEFHDGLVADVVVGDASIEVEARLRDGKVTFAFELGDWEISPEDLTMERAGLEEFLRQAWMAMESFTHDLAER